MKITPILHSAIYMMISIPILSQSSKEWHYNITNKENKGTAYDNSFKIKVVFQNGKYITHTYSNLYEIEVQKSEVTDSLGKVKEGETIVYDVNGEILSKSYYKNNIKNGTTTLYKNGKAYANQEHKDGYLVGSGALFTSDHEQYATYDMDKNGNGTINHNDKSFKPYTLKYQNGKCNDTILVETLSNTGKSRIVYKDNKIADMESWDNNGKPLAITDTVYYTRAKYKNKTNGWLDFCRENYEYPKIAIKKNIRGVVVFKIDIDESGNTSNVRILRTPHESLTNEVLRLIQLSGKWTPAKIYNLPVKTTLQSYYVF